jgi:hypothetical protein
MKFINLPSGRIIDVEKIAHVYPAQDKPPGIRFSFGAQYAELNVADSVVLLDALDTLGADTAELRKLAGVAKR